MIRFFSNLRRRLAAEGKLVKYLGYAAGEILLIVIGILIALQINAWAEDRKDRRFERATLAQIRDNLLQDYAALDAILALRHKSVQSIGRLLAFDSDDDSAENIEYWLADVIQFERFNSITNAYDVLKSRGLDIVQRDELRLRLGIYYDGWAREILGHLEDIETSFMDIWRPMLLRDFETFEWKARARPFDPVAFLADPRVANALRLERTNHRGAVDNLERMMLANADLRALIDRELRE